ncbi:MAG: hypothetical protein AAF913_00030 [Pseudomonadota bacterium]
MFIGDADPANLTVLVESDDGPVESIRLEVDGKGRVENLLPYALFGDALDGTVDGRDLNGGDIGLGERTLSFTAFGADGTQGNAVAAQTLTFMVADKSTQSGALSETADASLDTVPDPMPNDLTFGPDPAEPIPGLRVFEVDGDVRGVDLTVADFDLDSTGSEQTFDRLVIDVAGETYEAATDAALLELIRIAEAPTLTGMTARRVEDDIKFSFNAGGSALLDDIAAQLDQDALAIAFQGQDWMA